MLLQPISWIFKTEKKDWQSSIRYLLFHGFPAMKSTSITNHYTNSLFIFRRDSIVFYSHTSPKWQTFALLWHIRTIIELPAMLEGRTFMECRRASNWIKFLAPFILPRYLPTHTHKMCKYCFIFFIPNRFCLYFCGKEHLTSILSLLSFQKPNTSW